MPLRRKSSGRKTSSSSELVTPNGKIETLMKEKPAIIQECDFPCLPVSQDKQQRRPSTRSDNSPFSEDGKLVKDGKVRRESTGSVPTKGIARVRRTSRDCVIPEDIRISVSETPKLTIQDCGYVDMKHGSRPITLQRIKNERSDCMISIQELSESPHRYGVRFGVHKSTDIAHRPENSTSRLSVASQDSDGEHLTFQPPSSPLLVAMRTAVDSLNQYEDFEILEEIGAGFFAQVFKVRHKPTGQLMVLKKNKRKAVSLLKEVELLKRLQHPNILHYMGACIHEGQLHPLTEYVNGGALEQLIQGSDDFPWPLRVRLSQDISKGMEYLHKHGMLHRDLNSKNVLLRMHGSKYTAVVADFGLAAKSIPKTMPIRKLTRSQSIVGTPYWMAPEVLNGKPYNETADVFSYGIVLCEIITRLSADPDDIPRSRDYALDVTGFRKLPQVTNSSCPEEFMELAFLSSKFLPIERPCFKEITLRLQIIREIHNLDGPSQPESLHGDDTDTIVEPQPPIRLSYHKQQSGSMSPASLIHSLDFTDAPPHPRETSV